MKPVFKIGDHDYTNFVLELEPVRNDLDSDGAGRNLLDGLMYRARIAQKDKLTVKFIRLPEQIVQAISNDVKGEFAEITFLHPDLNRVITKTFYTSTLKYGSQKYSKGDKITVYDGCNFDMTER